MAKGLKQDIMVRNEYTVKGDTNNPKSGSRGSTPGAYVTRYMGRELATETLAPIKKTRVDDFVLRYFVREDAVERAVSINDAKEQMKQYRGYGGVAFGYGEVSLADESFKAAAADIQRGFDHDKTVFKTVISFDLPYLKRHGLVDQDFECNEKGDYRGNLDQMKLRLAIMQGLERMGRDFDDLRYVGVIQVDTKHAHCHLAMYDAGVGNIHPKDGKQRGKLSARQIAVLRRGVNDWLDEKSVVHHLSSAVGYERRNVLTYIKRWAHDQMLRESLPQFLISCLPEDRNLWRFGTNRKEMRKANELVTEYIEDLLDNPMSGMSQAMEAVERYALERRDIEGLSTQQWRRLVDNGRLAIVERCVNSVYAMIKTLPADNLRVRTPMMSVMSLDYKELASEATKDDVDDLVNFAFKLRSYSSRLVHHRQQRALYRSEAAAWEVLNLDGKANPASRPLYEFYRNEEEYHARCAAKYQSFLPLAAAHDDWYEGWDSVVAYGEKVQSLAMMLNDRSIPKMKNAEAAEAEGVAVYGQHGGKLLLRGKAGRKELEDRLHKMQQRYEILIRDFRSDLAQKGLRLELAEEIKDSLIVDECEYSFEEVKALDLHHLKYDFYRDVEIGKHAQEIFLDAARERVLSYNAAVEYLQRSGQAEAISLLPGADVMEMNKMASLLNVDHPVLHSRVADLIEEQQSTSSRRIATVPLSDRIAEQMQEVMQLEAQRVAAEVLLESDVDDSDDADIVVQPLSRARAAMRAPRNLPTD